eukprot:TRINITY_DN51594_c0_g1_i1.p1 TRINITY_DN51594_c0_g1~~TRINITY_DN51594_c0_g1_i1.p1  ORF type:complete len:126 (+),score=21.08 TRINITY_DN51594_c0_g1_i1:71-448(+)
MHVFRPFLRPLRRRLSAAATLPCTARRTARHGAPSHDEGVNQTYNVGFKIGLVVGEVARLLFFVALMSYVMPIVTGTNDIARRIEELHSKQGELNAKVDALLNHHGVSTAGRGEGGSWGTVVQKA